MTLVFAILDTLAILLLVGGIIAVSRFLADPGLEKKHPILAEITANAVIYSAIWIAASVLGEAVHGWFKVFA